MALLITCGFVALLTRNPRDSMTLFMCILALHINDYKILYCFFCLERGLLCVSVDGDFLEVCKDPLSVTIGKEFLKRFSNSKIVINGDDLTIKDTTTFEINIKKENGFYSLINKEVINLLSDVFIINTLKMTKFPASSYINLVRFCNQNNITINTHTQQPPFKTKETVQDLVVVDVQSQDAHEQSHGVSGVSGEQSHEVTSDEQSHGVSGEQSDEQSQGVSGVTFDGTQSAHQEPTNPLVKIVEVPVEKIKIVKIPVDRIVEKIKIVEVPVERVVVTEKIVEIIKAVVTEKIVQVEKVVYKQLPENGAGPISAIVKVEPPQDGSFSDVSEATEDRDDKVQEEESFSEEVSEEEEVESLSESFSTSEEEGEYSSESFSSDQSQDEEPPVESSETKSVHVNGLWLNKSKTIFKSKNYVYRVIKGVNGSRFEAIGKITDNMELEGKIMTATKKDKTTKTYNVIGLTSADKKTILSLGKQFSIGKTVV